MAVHPRDFFACHTIQDTIQNPEQTPKLSKTLASIDEFVSLDRRVVHLKTDGEWIAHSERIQRPWKQTLVKVILLALATVTIIPLALLLALKASYQNKLHKIIKLPPKKGFEKVGRDMVSVIASFLEPKEILAFNPNRSIHAQQVNIHDRALKLQLESRPAHALKLTGKQAIRIAIRFPTLTSLNLSRCSDIEDADLALLAAHCPKLEKLDLSHVELSERKRGEHIKDFKNLTHLNLSHTDANFLFYIGDLKKLTHLDLSGLLFKSYTQFKVLEGLTNLTHLNLQHTFTDSSNYDRLKYLTKLEYLNISFNNLLDDEDLRVLKNMPGLKRLYLLFCKKITEDGIQNLKGLKQLEYLNTAGSNDAPDPILRENLIMKFETLEEIYPILPETRCWKEMKDSKYKKAVIENLKLSNESLTKWMFEIEVNGRESFWWHSGFLQQIITPSIIDSLPCNISETVLAGLRAS